MPIDKLAELIEAAQKLTPPDTVKRSPKKPSANKPLTIGRQKICARCGQDIEWHGKEAGWIDRGAGRSCLPYKGKDGEFVRPKNLKHTLRERS